MRSLQNIQNTSFDDVFNELSRFAVGFEPTFRMLDKVRHSAIDSYPPYDLEKIDDEHYRLTMAVAGFKAADIDITIKNGELEIVGKTEKEENKVYLHKGIAGRNFRKVFYINSWLKVKSSSLVDGMLVIDFEQELPESMKPRKIEIQYVK